MTVRLAQGWQVMLADLALILFLATAATLAGDGAGGAGADHLAAPGVTAAASGPVGVFRAGGEIGLDHWLRGRATDPREVLTILSHHAPGEREAALATAARLADEAAAAGHEARIVIEPGARSEALALFAFDADASLAQALHEHALHESAQRPGARPAR